jgi:DNA polymerase-3 subunit delta
LSGLLWQFRKVKKMKVLLEENYSPQEMFSHLNMRNKKSQKIFAKANRSYSKQEIDQLIRLVHDFEVRVRSANNELTTLLLQLFVYYTVLKGGKIPSIDGVRRIG